MTLSTLLDAIAAWPPGVTYPALFAMALLENLFPPFPGDVVALFSGYLAGTGRLSLAGALLATAAGGWAGFVILFALGRVLGREWVNRRIRPRVAPGLWEAAEARLTRYGLWVVLANRFFAGLRSIIALVAGVLALSALHVVALAGVGSLVWHMLLVGAGYVIGEDWQRLHRLLAAYNVVVLTGIAILALIGLIFWIGAKKQRP